MTSLLDFLRAVPDKRRKQGIRYRLDAMLVLMLLAIMNGHTKYREMERFARRHKEFLSSVLGFKHGVPSNVSIRAVMRGMDWEAVQKQFNAWMLANLPTEDHQGVLARVLAFDGKSLRATVKDYEHDYQNFVCFLHGFLAAEGIIVHAQEYQNGHASEQHVLQSVLSNLHIKGYIITVDALHTQKKQSS